MTTAKDRIPGQDLLVEENVLGQILIHPDAMDLYASYGCTSDLFHKYAHRLIWSAASRLHAAQQPVDLVTVKTELDRTGAINEVTVRRTIGAGGDAGAGGSHQLDPVVLGLPPGIVEARVGG